MTLSPTDRAFVARYLEDAHIGYEPAIQAVKAPFEEDIAPTANGFIKWTVFFHRRGSDNRMSGCQLRYYTQDRRNASDIDPIQVFADNVDAACFAMRVSFEEWAEGMEVPQNQAMYEAYRSILTIGTALAALFGQDLSFEYHRLMSHGIEAITRM